MDQFKALSVTLLYSSLRVLYDQNKHKHIKIKNLVTFLKEHTFLSAQGNAQSAIVH